MIRTTEHTWTPGITRVMCQHEQLKISKNVYKNHIWMMILRIEQNCVPHLVLLVPTEPKNSSPYWYLLVVLPVLAAFLIYPVVNRVRKRVPEGERTLCFTLRCSCDLLHMINSWFLLSRGSRPVYDRCVIFILLNKSFWSIIPSSISVLKASGLDCRCDIYISGKGTGWTALGSFSYPQHTQFKDNWRVINNNWSKKKYKTKITYKCSTMEGKQT